MVIVEIAAGEEGRQKSRAEKAKEGEGSWLLLYSDWSLLILRCEREGAILESCEGGERASERASEREGSSLLLSSSVRRLSSPKTIRPETATLKW